MRRISRKNNKKSAVKKKKPARYEGINGLNSLIGNPIARPVIHNHKYPDQPQIGKSITTVETEPPPEPMPPPDTTPAPFITTWTLTAGETLTFPAPSALNDFTIDWGDNSGIEPVTTPSPTHLYAGAGDYVITIEGTCPEIYLAKNAAPVGGDTALIDINAWGNVGMTDLSEAFYECYGLVNVSAIDGSGLHAVTSMYYLFGYCSSMITLNVANWDTRSVTTFDECFYYCKLIEILNVTNWYTGSCVDMFEMFYGCYVVTILDVSKWDVSQVENFSEMFQDCYLLTELQVDDWDVRKATDIGDIFNACESVTSVNLSKWQLDSLTNLQNLFVDMTVLQTVDVSNLNTGHMTTFRNVFDSCPALTSIIGLADWDVSSVVNFPNIFRNLGSLSSLDGVSNWQPTSATTLAQFVANCPAIISLDASGWSCPSLETINAFCVNNTLLETVDITGIVNSSFTTVGPGPFYGMFQSNPALTTIVGLENLPVTGNAGYFFSGCSSIGASIAAQVAQWDASGLVDLRFMFQNTSLFDPDLSAWDISSLTRAEFLLDGSAFSNANYDALLLAWSVQPSLPSNVSIHFGTAQYTEVAAKGVLTSAGWTIVDGGPI